MQRDSRLDLLKWSALLLMTLSHLRFVWPELHWLSYPGRFSFVALCAIIAAHTARQGEPNRSTWKQLAYLAVAAVVSQVPYQALTGRELGNAMVTLLSGLAAMTGFRTPNRFGALFSTAAITVPMIMPIEYGIMGALLPGSFLFALSGSSRRWLLPAFLAAACQGGNLWQPILAALSSVAVLLLLSANFRPPQLPRIGLWAYVYYPAHMVLYASIASTLT